VLHPYLYSLGLHLLCCFTPLQELLWKSQAAAKVAKIDFEVVTERVIAEFNVFQLQKVIDFRDILLGYAEKQVGRTQHTHTHRAHTPCTHTPCTHTMHTHTHTVHTYTVTYTPCTHTPCTDFISRIECYTSSYAVLGWIVTIAGMAQSRALSLFCSKLSLCFFLLHIYLFLPFSFFLLLLSLSLLFTSLPG
jgi:hypothetical protein